MTMSRWQVRARRAVVVTVAGAVIGAGAIPAAIGGVHADPADCGGGALIAVAGTNDVGANHLVGAKQRYTGKNANNTDNPASPYAGAGAYRVITPEFPTELWPVGSVGYDDDVRRGTAATVAAIAEYQAACPGKPVTVVGYSQGARIAGDVLNAVATSTQTRTVDGVTYRKVVDPGGQEYWITDEGLSGELYSDPRRDGPESGRGIEQSILGLLPGLTMRGAREGGFGSIPVVTFCVAGDAICDMPDPLHDPLGALDALLGYFTKHAYYPWRMWRPVTDANTWTCAATPAAAAQGGTGTVDCLIPAKSALSGVRQDGVNRVRNALGLAPREVIDFLALRPNLNGLFPHANLSDLQPLVTPVLKLLPELPQLGYGGYLPSALLFSDIVTGLREVNLPAVLGGLGGLVGSAVSIAAMPLRFVEHWVGESVQAVRDGVDTDGSTRTPDLVAVAADEPSSEPNALLTPAPVPSPSTSRPSVAVADAEIPSPELSDDPAAEPAEPSTRQEPEVRLSEAVPAAPAA